MAMVCYIEGSSLLSMLSSSSSG